MWETQVVLKPKASRPCRLEGFGVGGVGEVSLLNFATRLFGSWKSEWRCMIFFGLKVVDRQILSLFFWPHILLDTLCFFGCWLTQIHFLYKHLESARICFIFFYGHQFFKNAHRKNQLRGLRCDWSSYHQKDDQQLTISVKASHVFPSEPVGGRTLGGASAYMLFQFSSMGRVQQSLDALVDGISEVLRKSGGKMGKQLTAMG